MGARLNARRFRVMTNGPARAGPFVFPASEMLAVTSERDADRCAPGARNPFASPYRPAPV
jgi:hypothetical protein